MTNKPRPQTIVSRPQVQDKPEQDQSPKDAVLDRVPGDGRAYTSYLLSATGLCLWLLQTYAFHGNMPSQVSGPLYTLVPGIVGYACSYFLKKHGS